MCGTMAAAMVVQSFPPHSVAIVSHCTELEATSLRLPSATRRSPLNSYWPSAACKLRLSLPHNCSSVHRRSESISLCTNSEAVDVLELSALLAATQQNCEQFPTVLSDGSIVPVDPVKLRRALRHSTVVVALYVEDRGTGSAESNGVLPEKELDRRPPVQGWLDYWIPQPPGHKTLVAFGRATSDSTLTASIYDLVSRAGIDVVSSSLVIYSVSCRNLMASIMLPLFASHPHGVNSFHQLCFPNPNAQVAPAYQRLGYGSRVLLKIVRELRRRGIADIAATPSPELRPFFQSCGFGADTLKSVTMMYTHSPPSATGSCQIKEWEKIPPHPATSHSSVILHSIRIDESNMCL